MLGEPAQPESGTPVRHLSNSDSIDASVNTCDTIFAVDVGEDTEGGLGLDSSGSLLVSSDLDSLHARAEAHCSVRLSNTTDNTSRNTGGEVTSAESTSMVSVWVLAGKVWCSGLSTYSASEETKSRTAPLVDASIQACFYRKSVLCSDTVTAAACMCQGN